VHRGLVDTAAAGQFLEPLDVCVQLGLPVVPLDPQGERVPRQAEALDELL